MGRALLVSFAAAAAGCGARIDGEALDELGAENPIDTQSAQIISGSTNWAGKELIRYRTVSVLSPTGGGCTGTLLKPNVLLTARHCVTTDGLINGPLGAPSAIAVRINAVATLTPTCQPGAGRSADCTTGAEIVDGGPKDVVVVRLMDRLTHPNFKTPVTPFAFGSSPFSRWGNKNLTVSGWGDNTCAAGGSGTLRWGTSLYASNSADGNMSLTEVDGQIPWRGDSGGPVWAEDRAGVLQLGVASRADCGVSVSEVATASIGAFLDTALSLPQMNRNLTSPLTSLSEVNLEATAPATFTASSAGLRVTTNSARSFALMRGQAEHVLVNFTAAVLVNGPDNDSSGVVVNYIDSDNYLLCEVNAESHYVRWVSRRLGVDQVSGSQTWLGTYASDVGISATVNQSGCASCVNAQCSVSGGGVATVQTGSFAINLDNGPLAGQVGIFNHFNQNATHRSFRVTH